MRRRDFLKAGIAIPVLGSIPVFGKLSAKVEPEGLDDQQMTDKILNWHGPCMVYTQKNNQNPYWHYLNCWGDVVMRLSVDGIRTSEYICKREYAYINGIRNIQFSERMLKVVNGNESESLVVYHFIDTFEHTKHEHADIEKATAVIFTVYRPGQWSCNENTIRHLFRKVNGRWILIDTATGIGIAREWYDDQKQI